MAENQRLIRGPKEERIGDDERDGGAEEEAKTKKRRRRKREVFGCESRLGGGGVHEVGEQLSSRVETLGDDQQMMSCCNSVMNSEQVLCGGGEDVKPSICSGFEGQYGMSHQELLANVTAQAVQSQAKMEGHTGCPPSSSDMLPPSLKQPISLPISPVLPQPRVSVFPQDPDACLSEVDLQNSIEQKVKTSDVAVKAPSADGYNWRKYGQKLVKSNESSRSYYRCTQINCLAKKKVEHSDHSGCVIAIVYKGRHNHEPPRKIRCTKARRSVASTGSIPSAYPDEENGIVAHVAKKLDSDSLVSRREAGDTKPEKQLQGSCTRVHNIIVKAEEHDTEPNAKQREEEDTAYLPSLFKAVKEPKIVVQASGDVGISGDGYRWRKYGQKMVKGNPNPRADSSAETKHVDHVMWHLGWIVDQGKVLEMSYYKCTSAGCPVRKHVERAIDGTTTIIITYEGKHDHDMPVPKKRHGPPSAGLLINAAAAMNSTQVKNSETLPNQKTSTQWSMDVEGECGTEKASELGGEKALESARTLLSIGIELRPY
ncbi:hypothetical protein Sjap_010880 [Stephania japonica]|uniref:WRKY domain-containing protein n=1 Tax=Stephania japonica TaxID=461633 RepID=A0AAP0JAE4_9MAGN